MLLSNLLGRERRRGIGGRVERVLKLLKRYDTRRGRPEPITRRRNGAQRPSFAEAVARLEQRLRALGYEIDEEAVPPRADDAEAA